MRIRYTQSLQVAHKVRLALDKLVPISMAKNMWIESWANCREQGLCFNYGQYKAVTSECRGSDSIIVIVGKSMDFNNQTNQPSEKIWSEARTFFEPGEYGAAALHIMGYFAKMAHLDELAKETYKGAK